VITLTEAGASGGNPAISISGPDAGDFSQSDTCAKYMGPGESCTISVIFKPPASGVRTAYLNFGPAGATPQTASLIGGLPLSVRVSPSSLSFGNQG
jgi:hypothetical protein